jgi:hypothetical protein
MYVGCVHTSGTYLSDRNSSISTCTKYYSTFNVAYYSRCSFRNILRPPDNNIIIANKHAKAL